jgi:hypothetical protein
MAKVNIWCGWVQSELDTQWHPCRMATGQFLSEFGFNQKLFAAALDYP